MRDIEREKRCCTARGSSIRYSQFSPTKFEAHKSFLFTESSLVLKIKNTWVYGVLESGIMCLHQ